MKAPFWVQAVRLGSANIVLLVAQISTYLALGLLADPTEFGLFMLGLSVAQLFSSFATARFDGAIPAARSARAQSALVLLSLAAMAGLALIQLAILLGLQRARLFELDRLSPFALAIVLLLTSALAAAQMGRYAAVRAGGLDRIERATYVRAAALLAGRGGVILLLAAGGAWSRGMPTGLVLLAVELGAAGITALAVRPRMATQALRRAKAPRYLRAAARSNWKFPLVETPSTMLDSLAINAPIFLVTQFFGLQATASFGLAYRAVAVPIGQLALAFTEVLQARYVRMRLDGEFDAFRRTFRGSTANLLALGAVGCVIAYLFTEPVVVAIAGAKLREFARICVIIAPWVAMSVLVNIHSRLLALLKRQELKLVYDVLNLLVIVVLYALQGALDMSLLEFVGALSASQVATYVIYWLLIRRAVNGVGPRNGMPARVQRSA